jgi:hypothetical protein
MAHISREVTELQPNNMNKEDGFYLSRNLSFPP